MPGENLSIVPYNVNKERYLGSVNINLKNLYDQQKIPREAIGHIMDQIGDLYDTTKEADDRNSDLRDRVREADDQNSKLSDRVREVGAFADLNAIRARRQLKWTVGVAGLGIVLAGFAAAGGASYNDSQLRPLYDNAVADYNKSASNNNTLRSNVADLEQKLRDANTQIKDKDGKISEYQSLFQEFFGKPPEPNTELPK